MGDWAYQLLSIVVSLAVLVVLWLLYRRLAGQTQGYPMEAQIEAALMPLLYQAICSAYRLSEQAVDEGYERLKGVDKKAMAERAYAMLPDKIGDYDLTLVKQLIPPDRFTELVQDAFDRFDRFYIEHREHFDKEFEAWKQAQPQPA